MVKVAFCTRQLDSVDKLVLGKSDKGYLIKSFSGKPIAFLMQSLNSDFVENFIVTPSVDRSYYKIDWVIRDKGKDSEKTLLLSKSDYKKQIREYFSKIRDFFQDNTFDNNDYINNINKFTKI